MIYNWKRIVKNSFPLLIVCVVIEILAGQLMFSRQELLVSIPVFLIAIPVINGVGGNVGSVLGARIASGLHVGSISISLKDQEMRDGFVTAILMGTLTYVLLSVILYHVVSLFLNVDINVVFIEFVLVMSIAGIALVVSLCLISVVTAFWSFKKGFDPDDMVAPVVTTFGDVLGIAFLFLFLELVL